MCFHENTILKGWLLFLVGVVGKEINAEEESAILRMVQAVAVPVIGNVCHVFMNGLNRVQVCEVVWSC